MSTSTIQNQTVSPALLAAMNPAPAASASASDDAQNRFLKLLVTQMQNQDPLNPMDNAQVTTQMAQLNMVSGIDKLNTTLQSLVAGVQSSEGLQAAAMVGHSVLVPGSSLALQNGSALGGVELTQPADHVVVTIKDGSGSVVHTADLGAQPAGSITFQWDGMTDGGSPAANGSYSFSVQATQANAKVDAAALAVGSVTSIIHDAKGTSLGVMGLGRIDLSQVKQIF